MLASAPSSAWAQGSLTGLVTDAASGRPLSSAQVFIDGSGLGGLTNASGRYLIVNVPAGQHTLRATLIGFNNVDQMVTVSDGQATSSDFSMSQAALALDGIVVTGTAGQARRREVGNQIAQVNIADVPEAVTGVGELLQTRVVGARIQFGSGNSGSGADIRLRGNSSTALSNQPLIYIDGMRAKSEPSSSQNGAEDPYSPLNDLNPDDIDRIEVVKGPAATTLYGAEAAAGVIQIFTKRGGNGAPQWTAETQQGYSYFRPFGTDEVPYLWLDQVFRKGHRQRYSMSVRGGTDDIGYFVSGAWNDNVGAVETDGEQKMNVRANVTFSPTEDLMLQFNNTFARTDITQAQMGNSVTSIMMTAIRGPKNYMSGLRDQKTLRLLLNGEEYKNTITRATTGLTINYTPGADFTHRLTVGYDYSQDDHFNSQDYCWLCPIGIMSNFSDYMLEGEGRRGMSQNAIWSLDYTGSLAMDLGWLTDGLRSTLSFGMQGVENEIENTEVVGRNYPGPGEYTLSSAATKQSMNQNRLRVITGGFFAQNMLAFQDKYFVTAGMRVDGNSAFGESLGFELYPKLSGSYVLSDEGFFPEGFGEIKLRAAYGFAGRSPGAFDKVRTWSPVGFNYNEQAFYPNNLGNSALGPERTREYEYGMDGSWFNGRFSAELTYYHQLTSDALFRVASSQTAGGWGKQLENVGEFENKGWEVGTNTTIFNGQNFGWDLGLGLSTNHSKVLSLGGAAQFSVGEYGWVIEGQPVPVIYAKQITNANEKADAVYSSGNTVYGPANPTHIYSANTSIRLPGGLQVSARGEYLKGAYISNYFEAGATGRTIAHPKCYDAYRKVDPNWVQGTLGSNTGPKWPGSRPADMYAWEEGQCFGMATYHYANSESDFAELRDLTLSVPISNLLPGMFTFSDRTDLTISGRNVAFWTHKNLITGHPEQNENSIGTTDSGEFRHDMVKGIDETLPPVSYWTVAMRMIF
jgi:outer membrane receptor protein involved in Fe transport